MQPIVKRVLGAIAIKEVIDRVQEARKPKKGLIGRLGSPVVLVAVAGGVYYLYRTGKLTGLIEQGKDLMNQDGPSEQGPSSSGNGSAGNRTLRANLPV